VISNYCIFINIQKRIPDKNILGTNLILIRVNIHKKIKKYGGKIGNFFLDTMVKKKII